MIRLQLLGPLALCRENGNAVHSVLAQPKRFALLTYLALSPAPVAHRRDTLVGMFWPELDDEHARQALRQALYGLRQSLGSKVIVGTGEELVGVDGTQLWCDAASFAAAIREGRDDDALELYRGPFLDGFHISGVPAFERWMDGERRRLEVSAAQAAWRLVEGSATDRATAQRWAERALALAPYDEEGLRRYMLLMAEHGQAAAAARAYQTFAERLKAEFQLAASAQTTALAEEIRVGHSSLARTETTRSRTATTLSPAAFAETTSEPATITSASTASIGTKPRRLGLVALLTTSTVILFTAVLLLNSAGNKQPVAAAFSDQPANAVAVLPFENLSTQPEHAYFAAGLHDELLTQLSKLRALTLRGRSSVMAYASTKKSGRQIAQELGVGTLLVGSVQVLGNRLRVNVQLIDASDDEHLWAESYDRTLDDAFAIQSDIAQRVVAAVGATLAGAEQQELAAAPTTNAEAYSFYLQGRGYYRRPGWLRENFEIAERLYTRALTLDPEFALAYVGLSEVHGGMHWFRYDPSARRVQQQREAAEAALRLAPQLSQAHMAMGLAHYWGQRDYTRALNEFTIAVQGMPSDPWPVLFVGYVHRRLGNWSEALAAFNEAAQLDSRDATVFLDLGGHTYKAIRQYDQALQAYERAQSLAPDLQEAAVRRARTYVLWRGQLDSLRAVLQHLPADTDLGALGTAKAQRVRLLFWERQADSLLRVVAEDDVVFDEHIAYLPAALYAGWAQQLRGDTAAARAAFRTALLVLDSVAQQLPNDWRVHAARGLALAGLSRRDEALLEAQRLAESVEFRDDAFFGPVLAEERARIFAQLGETEAALNEIEKLLTGSSFTLSAHTLRIDPLWDPIRNHPRYRALLTRHSGG